MMIERQRDRTRRASFCLYVIALGCLAMPYKAEASKPVDIEHVHSVVPRCMSQELQDGVYQLQPRVRITVVGETSSEGQLDAVAERFALFLRKGAGLEVKVGGTRSVGESEISLRVTPDLFESKAGGAYRLSVHQEGIHITGMDEQGVFYGLQSLKQMLPAAIFHQNYTAHGEVLSDLRIACVEIEDAPRFSWRGFMLDSCRHMQPVDKIKQYLDLMALYKMNVFHWHLTEDEAWRAEIKKYPKLTSIGGYPGDRSKDQELNGYYTQEQMREIVAYAHERYIKVVPEFDIPGHVNALLMAYPEYGCNEGTPLEMGKPGMRAFSSKAGRGAICAGKHQTTIPFIMDVFAELQEIFTDGLLHIGGDERPRGSWDKCNHCIALKNKLNLENEEYLQNWFLNEVSERLGKRGIRTIAWAEHLEGGIPEGQIVQAWNKASEVPYGVRAGRDVINSFNRKLYLDYPANLANLAELNKHNRRYRGRLVSTRSIYGFDPVPSDLSQEERARVIGVEAPVWTEDILMDRLDKKVFPRLIAVAEVAWTSEEMKNWESFQHRFEKQAQILYALNITYDRSDSIIETKNNLR